MTTAGIASIPSRRLMLEQVLDSIAPQVGQVFLVLNYGDEPPPEYLDKYSNVFWYTQTDTRGDAMKFSMAHFPDDTFFGCDDDLLYPDGYFEYLEQGIKKYDGLVSLHGRDYRRPITSFKDWVANYRCLGTVANDIIGVDLVGSGCCAFDTNRLKVKLSDFKKSNMADCYLSRLAHIQGVPKVVLKHDEGYLKYLYPHETIWKSTHDFTEQLSVLKSFLK